MEMFIGKLYSLNMEIKTETTNQNSNKTKS